MDRQINGKWGALLKYVPFIDFIVEMNIGDYKKFKIVKKWIINKNRYHLWRINKIEQSIIEQYQNLIVLDDKKIPQKIKKLFCDEIEQQCVNLCSDDDDGETETGTSRKQMVSTSIPQTLTKSRNIPKRNDVIKNQSLLRQIDQVSDKKKCQNNREFHVNKNKTYISNYVRRRRNRRIFKERVVGIISLDSSDEDNCTSIVGVDGVTEEITLLDDQEINPNIALKECNVDNTKKEEHSLRLDIVESETVANLTNSMSQGNKPPSSALISQQPLHNLTSGASHLVQDLDTTPSAIQIRFKNNCETPKTSSAPCIMTQKEYKEAVGDEHPHPENDREQEYDRKRPKVSERKEKRDIKKVTDESRSILLSTLQPYEEKIASMWELHKKPKNTSANMSSERVLVSRETENTFDVCETNNVHEEKKKDFNKTRTEEDKPEKNIEEDHIHNESNENKEISEESRSKRANEEKNKIDRISRIFKELECTFKGYDKCSPLIIGRKRRSSVQCRAGIAELLDIQPVEKSTISSTGKSTKESLSYKHCTSSDVHAPVDAGGDCSTSQSLTKSFKNGKRLSSVHARSAISDCLSSKSVDSNESDSELSSAESCASKRRKTIDEVSMSVEGYEGKNKIDQSSRILKELECTFKGYDKFTPLIIGSKRRSSVHARTAIAELLNVQTNVTTTISSSRKSTEQSSGHKHCISSDEHASVDAGGDSSTSQSQTKSFKNGKRLSSVHARSAIAEGLNSVPVDSDQGGSELPSAESCTSKRRKTIDEVSMSVEGYEGKNKIDQSSRILKELECTFKGYDKFTPLIIGSKRRSSVHARTAIAELLNVQTNVTTTISSSRKSTEQSSGHKHCISSDEQTSVDAGDNCSTSQSLTKSFIDGKRLSSLHARLIIAEQLNSELVDSVYNTDQGDSKLSSAESCASKRRRSIDEVSMSVEGKQLEKLNDYSNNSFRISPSSRSCNLKHRMRIYDSDSEHESKAKFCKEKIMQNQPRVLIKRLNFNKLRKHTKQCDNLEEKNINSSNILNVQLVESRIQCDTTKVFCDTSTAAMIHLPRKLNNNPEMTKNNTTFCALCSSKPSDLTNHYIRKHKSESYVSRLTWSQLSDLSINTRFAKMLSSPNKRTTIYSVTCPFCNEELREPFMNLYMHYSTHTGEYAFRCSGCQLQKPFKADVQSHQLHSKTCRCSRIQTMYLYPPKAMVIYLHYCIICYFVQLNEANVLRHLRIHHDQRQATSHNVKKCILVAITDGNDISNELQLTSTDINNHNRLNRSNIIHNIKENEQLRKDCMNEVAGTEMNLNLDDDIPVRNEACSEQLSDSVAYLSEEQQLKQILEDPPLKSTIPRTEDLESNSSTTKTPSRIASRHFQNLIDFGDNCLTPPRPSLQRITLNLSSRSTYRSYPSNVEYMGLYKCMSDDCYYSTDSSNEMLNHLEDHGRENLSGEYLQCAYCSILEGTCKSTQQLVDHIGEKHLHMIFQCSMCCYRSCEASNVSVHQKEIHADSYQTCTIYKGYGKQIIYNPKYINEQIAQNVRKLQCQYCSHISFYNSNLLEHHIKTDHKLRVPETLKYYSCIYCPLIGNDESLLRTHIALKHPEELPYVCGHNNCVSDTTDLLQNLQAVNLAQPVPVIKINDMLDAVIEENHKLPVADVKPTAEELVTYHEETIKVRLRKLTENTGVAPDSLYQCSESYCGGFFSIYDLWLRHMRAKHNFYECQCPHCPIEISRPLEFYKEHFEVHRRHTYICFHCPLTFANKKDAKVHAYTGHSALGLMRFEQIYFNLNYSYFVLIQTGILPVRSEFMAELLTSLNNRLQKLKISESKNLKRTWLISTPTAPWLEDYERYISRKLRMKCFNDNCSFRATENGVLFKHVREKHKISGTTFNCCQCDFNLQGCQEWDGILNHIKQHSDPSFFICDACSSYHYSRRRLTNHIREEHAARDVPVINLINKGKKMYLSLSVVFANERLSFSTLRSCFCCEERDMKSDALILHLKRYHKLVLNYVCEWCNLPIESLQAAEEHFKEIHTRNRLKIRCDLSSKSDLSVISICNLRVHIDSGKAGDRTPLTVVKPEPNNDDSVILLEDDDVVAEKYVRDQDKIGNESAKPKLKCIAMAKFLNPSLPSSTNSGLSNLQVSLTSTTTSKVTSTNNMRPGLNQQFVPVPPARINTSISNITDCNQYGITSIGTVSGPLHSGQTERSTNCHTQDRSRIFNVQNTEQFSLEPNVTKRLDPQQQATAFISGSANGPTPNRIIPNQAGTGFLPTTLHALSHASAPISTIESSLQNSHTSYGGSASNSKSMNGPASNSVTYNEYRVPSCYAVAAPIISTTVSSQLVYPRPRVSATQNRTVTTPYVHHQQVATSSSTNLNISTSDTVMSNQYRIASSTDVPVNSIMHVLPNDSSMYSDPHIYAPSSTIDSHVQNQNLFSESPTFVATHRRQYGPNHPKSSNSKTSSTPVNTCTPVTNTVATCLPNSGVTGQNITINKAIETANALHNMSAPSTPDGLTNHPVYTPAMGDIMHQSLHLTVPSTISGMTNNLQPISGISTTHRVANHRPSLTSSAMSRLPATSTMRGLTNHPQQLPSPYNMPYSSQNVPTPSTMISQIPALPSSRMSGSTNRTQHITKQTNIRLVNQPQHTAPRFTPHEIPNHRSFLTPSSNCEIAKRTQDAPVQSTEGVMINNSLHMPASMRGLTSPTQHMAVPFAMSSMTNHTDHTINRYQHINEPSTTNSYVPTANSSRYQYIHAPSNSTITGFSKVAPIFDGSYTNDATSINGPPYYF